MRQHCGPCNLQKKTTSKQLQTEDIKQNMTKSKCER